MVNFVEMLVDFMEIKFGMDFVVNVIEKFINKLNKFKKHMMEKQCEKILDIIFKLNTRKYDGSQTNRDEYKIIDAPP